jgi:hypothetical protein
VGSSLEFPRNLLKKELVVPGELDRIRRREKSGFARKRDRK